MYFMTPMSVMTFDLLLLLRRFEVTESYNDIKLKNHKYILIYKYITINQFISVLSAQAFHTYFNLVDKYYLLE